MVSLILKQNVCLLQVSSVSWVVSVLCVDCCPFSSTRDWDYLEFITNTLLNWLKTATAPRSVHFLATPGTEPKFPCSQSSFGGWVQNYLPLHLTGTHSTDLVMYPVFRSTSRLNRGSRYGSLMFRSSPVLATYPAIPLLMGNLWKRKRKSFQWIPQVFNDGGITNCSPKKKRELIEQPIVLAPTKWKAAAQSCWDHFHVKAYYMPWVQITFKKNVPSSLFSKITCSSRIASKWFSSQCWHVR